MDRRVSTVLASLGCVTVALAFVLLPPNAPVYAGGKSDTGAKVAAPTKPAVATAPEAPGCPKEMAKVGRSCIDRWEGRLLRRASDGTLAPHPAHERPKDGSFVAESRAGVRPQGYISRPEAALACENAGKRLCSIREWYGACRGEKDTLFPYGATFVKGRCNVGKPHLLSILHGKDPSQWKYDEGFNDPELDQRPGFLGNTGEYGECVTSGGVYDMVGNLHEWVADKVDLKITEKIPLTWGVKARLHANLGKGVFMGGFFSTTNQHGEGCDFSTMAHEPGYHDYSTGFRCCKEP